MTNPADHYIDDVTNYPTDPENPNARLPHLGKHERTRYEVIATGVVYLPFLGFKLCCLINVAPCPTPKFIFYRGGVDDCANIGAYEDAGRADGTDYGIRVVCKDDGANAEDGWVILNLETMVGAFTRDELHVDPTPSRGMRLVTNTDRIGIDPVDPKRVKLVFSGFDLQFVPDMVHMSADFLDELLFIASGFLEDGGHDSDYRRINQILDRIARNDVPSDGNDRDVPAWCFDLMRLYMSRCDEVQDGRRLWSSTAAEAVVTPLERIVRHMRQILTPSAN